MSVEVEGYIVVVMDDKPFTLRGKVGDHINVQYHRAFDKALSIGTFATIGGTVAGALGFDKAQFEKQIEALKTNLKGLSFLADILEHADIKLTDLGINTKDGVYELGLGLDLSHLDTPAQIGADAQGHGGVKLNGFGAVLKYTKPKDGKPSQLQAPPAAAAAKLSATGA